MDQFNAAVTALVAAAQNVSAYVGTLQNELAAAQDTSGLDAATAEVNSAAQQLQSLVPAPVVVPDAPVADAPASA